MKENVIIGKLIPAGTGMKRYRNIKLDSDINEDDELTFDDMDDLDFETEESAEAVNTDEAEAMTDIADETETTEE